MSFFSPYHRFPALGKIHWLCLAILAIACMVASIDPLDFHDYLLHQVGTAIGVIILLLLAYQRSISLNGFILTTVFLVIHVLGAHYLYSSVPYNQWFIQYFHFDLNNHFGWSRNMYDRLVHFAYGLLLFKLCTDVIAGWLPSIKKYQISLLALQFIMASSMIYELIEWMIALNLSPEQAESYNGQQGDIWDAHKDMLLATLGAIIAWIIQTSVSLIKIDR